MTILHANPLIPATAALQREKISCPVFASKSGQDRRRDIKRAAAGKDIVLRGMQPGEPVVN